jgi:hypothetical protein
MMEVLSATFAPVFDFRSACFKITASCQQSAEFDLIESRVAPGSRTEAGERNYHTGSTDRRAD